MFILFSGFFLCTVLLRFLKRVDYEIVQNDSNSEDVDIENNDEIESRYNKKTNDIYFSSVFYIKVIDVSEWYLHKFCWGKIEDVICILTMLCLSLYLIAMVLSGRCSEEEEQDVLKYVTCNPRAENHNIPTDQMLIIYLAPTGIMMFLRGVSWMTVVGSWIASSGVMLFCLLYVHAEIYHLITLVPLCSFQVLLYLYEVERTRLYEYISMEKNLIEKLNTTQLQHNEEKMNVVFDLKKKLVRYISHEIRSPLNVIGG